MAHDTNPSDLELFARCASGFEGVLARELKGMRCHRVRPLKGGVAFFGTLEDAYRTCLMSRVATRVQLVLARIAAHDAEALYAGIAGIPWEEHVAPGATIAVQAHGTNAQLRNTQFTALKAKDALCDRLRETRGMRPDVDAHDPDFAIDLALHGDKASVSLNLSGPSLHRRGYREQSVQTEAPLKETLAAGMLLAAGWQELAESGAAFADPMCGSGTLAIEAALIAAHIAPGILRTRWGFEGWLQHEAAVWEHVVAEARAAERTDELPRIVAGDIDAGALAIAQANAERAGVRNLIEFSGADASTLAKRLRKGRGAMPETGLVAVNPPYGHRLQDADQLPDTYAALVAGIAGLPEGWRLAAITPDAGIDTALGQAPRFTVACYNGPIEASVRVYDAVAAQRCEIPIVSLAGMQKNVAVAERASEQFAGRLRKVAKERAKWARKAGISCYRIYDADLPDYAFSIDLYRDAASGANHLRIEEHQMPATVDADRASRRFSDGQALTCALLDVARENMVAQRFGQAGTDTHDDIIAEENGHRFEVDLAAGSGTGLPLDYRPVREFVGSAASGARFLSLYAFGGAPAVYAASCGAAQTTTVDPSKTFLDQARRVMQDNGFTGGAHRFELAAPATWLEHARGAYDLIYCDTPDLAVAAAQLLAQGGTLVLTTSMRKPSIDFSPLASAGYSVEDVTARTIPHDFERTPKIHRCWIIRRP